MMHKDPRSDDRTMSESLRASLIMLVFGLSILAVLVAIDRPHWFHLKPATGTATALSIAADRGGDAAARN
jgi:hypothetical protein